MKIPKQSLLVYLVWVILFLEAIVSAWLQQWNEAFVAIVILALTFLPFLFEERFNIHIPLNAGAMIVLFLFATLFLGEIGNFYERYWWWDLVLHSGAAIGVGLIGFVMVFMLFEGDKYAAPPIALAILTFFIAMAIGAIWEIFEYLMDQIFGLNMQKSGLNDTMWDLIVNFAGAAIAGFAGYFYLHGRWFGGLAKLIEQFVKANKKFFRKNK